MKTNLDLTRFKLHFDSLSLHCFQFLIKNNFKITNQVSTFPNCRKIVFNKIAIIQPIFELGKKCTRKKWLKKLILSKSCTRSRCCEKKIKFYCIYANQKG